MSSTSTGITGLDEILRGGLTPYRVFLIEGTPGAGKTTLAMQFLLQGVREGERALYITLSETAEELRASAKSHGWTFEGVDIREYIANDATTDRDRELTMFHPSEAELGNTMNRMLADINQLRPQRVVIDALSELRLLSDSPLRYRRQLLALKNFFSACQCTVMLLDDRSAIDRDSHVESVVHGVLTLEHGLTDYGSDQRRVRVRKMRGRSFQAGLHDYSIRRGGLEIFPRLVAAAHRVEFERNPVASGLQSLDQLMGGGPQAGTSTLLMGPAGSGKTTVAMQYALAAAGAGNAVAIYVFDELRELLIDRMADIGIDLAGEIEAGRVLMRQVDPTQQSPGEFAAQVRDDVEHRAVKMVIIDSLNGYLNAMPHEEFLAAQLHELLGYLGNQGIVTFLVVAQQGIVGANMRTPVDASYLADSIVLFRYFESRGEVRKAISVAKKRGGSHENTIRELVINHAGIQVGPPLSEFQGVLTGVPAFLTAVPKL